METNKDIQSKIDKVLGTVDGINEVKVSPFFKDKAMQRLFTEKEEQNTVWSWFTPKMQLATLVCVVLLNVMAFSQLSSSSYNDNVGDFAETFGLSTDTETETILFN